MKKILPILFIILLAQTAFAQTAWTVRSVPNTRLQGNEIHISDPDGYLSDSAEWFINDALGSIRDQADVFLVTLTSIGSDEPKHFATALFNYWGIGDAEADNGVLLLFVEDQRALEFETGYGAENVLTDARCSRIFNNTIVPYFKEGDYEGGLCAGVIDIVEVYDGAVPMGLRALTPQAKSDEDYGDDIDDMSMGEVFLFLLFVLMAFIVPIISFFRWIAALFGKKKKQVENDGKLDVFEQDGIKMINAVPSGWKSSAWEGKAFLRFLVYGVGAFAIFLLAQQYVSQWMPEASDKRQEFWSVFLGFIVYFSVTSLIQNALLLNKAKKAALESQSPRGIYSKALNDAHSAMMRVLAPWVGIPFGIALRKRKENSVQCMCPTCGAEMMQEEGFQLPGKRAAEEQVGAYHFTACRCPSGHQYVLRENGSHHNSVRECKACGAFAMKNVKERTTVSPTYTSNGIKEITYECQFCHAQHTATQFIPKLTRSSSSGSSYRGSSHSGGSFGGGHSGGGGFSGRW